MELYKENTAHGRHLETQRQLVSGFVLTLGGVVLAALGTLKFERSASQWLGGILVCAGLLGAIFSIVQYGKWRESRERWRAFSLRISQLCPTAEISRARSIAKDKMRERWNIGWLLCSVFPLHWLWTMLNLFVLVLGIIVVTKPFAISVGAEGKPTTNPPIIQIQQTEATPCVKTFPRRIQKPRLAKKPSTRCNCKNSNQL